MKREMYLWTCGVITTCLTLICITSLSSVAETIEKENSYVDRLSDKVVDEIESRVINIQNSDNMPAPKPKLSEHGCADLSKRSSVYYENGLSFFQIFVNSKKNPKSRLLLAHLHPEVANLIIRDAHNPLEIIKTSTVEKKGATSKDIFDTAVLSATENQFYFTHKGDSLWEIEGYVRLATKQSAEFDTIDLATSLSVSNPPRVGVFSSHYSAFESSPPNPGKESLLANLNRMVDDPPLPHWLFEGFSEEITESQPSKAEKVIEDGDFKRHTVTAEAKLELNQLEGRARKFHTLVQSYAKKHNLDPALIMAIIHTESMFNPQAQSRAPAYGLMQLVPHSGASDAYLKIYGQKRTLTSHYLYDPKNNVELGVAYFNIIRNIYMKAIENPISRTYCAVAAYNAGAANVGRAFVLQKSMNMAIPVINTMEPQEVYARLVEKLPYKESRNYIQKVVSLSNLYSKWQ